MITVTMHEICKQAILTTCVCGATPGQPCACPPGGVHLARVTRARRAGLIGLADFASVIHDGGIVGASTVVLDPGPVPS